jgi:hypothetical protein
LIREVWKEAKIIHIGVNDMKHIVANIALNLCCVGLQEVGESEHFEVALTEDKITYRESVGDVGPFKSVLSLSTSILGPLSNISGPFMSISGLSMSLDDIGPPHTYIDIADPSSSWSDAPDSSISVSGLSTS